MSVWLHKAGINRSTVTLFSWAGFAYAFKYLWSPLVDNFKIPSNGKTGNWIVKIGNEENFVEKSFNVVELTDTIQVNLDRDDRIYRGGDLIAISGKNASIGSSVTVSVTDLNGIKVTPDLFISITSTGEFYTIWQLPKNIEPGIYDISVNDSVTDASISFTVN